jgi:hypothetical protein
MSRGFACSTSLLHCRTAVERSNIRAIIAPPIARLCRRRRARRSLASAFDPATMHDGSGHEPTHHGAAMMMCKARGKSDGTMELATTTRTELHDIITVSDLNDRWPTDDADCDRDQANDG